MLSLPTFKAQRRQTSGDMGSEVALCCTLAVIHLNALPGAHISPASETDCCQHYVYIASAQEGSVFSSQRSIQPGGRRRSIEPGSSQRAFADVQDPATSRRSLGSKSAVEEVSCTCCDVSLLPWTSCLLAMSRTAACAALKHNMAGRNMLTSAGTNVLHC